MFKLLLISLLFSGCASWKANYDFCKKTDWRELGMRDGKDDKKMEDTYAKYKMMCKDFDDELQPDLTLYRFGHNAAIKSLCTYDRGREFGLNRQKTSNNCTKKQYPKFYQGIKDGIDEYCNFDNGVKRAKEGYATSEVCERELAKHADFFQGVTKGLVSYCTFDFGLKVGTAEGEYRGVCKGQVEKEFLGGFYLGKARTKVKKLETDISQMSQDNVKLEEQIKSATRENFRLKRNNYTLNQEYNGLQ